MCSKNYYRLIDKGIIFADINTTSKFSIEAISDQYPNLKNSLGFHGKFHIQEAYSIINQRFNLK